MTQSLLLTVAPAAVFLMVATITPGPNNILIASSVVSHGYGRTVPYILGVCAGFPALVAFIGVGVHGIFEAVPGAKRAFEFAALGMLLWMSYKVATSSVDLEGDKPKGAPPGFVFSLLFQWINPKAWTVGVSLITLYSDPDRGFFSAHMLALLVVSVAVSVASTHAWVGFGAVMSAYLRDPRHLKIYNWTMGALLMVSAVAIFGA